MIHLIACFFLIGAREVLSLLLFFFFFFFLGPSQLLSEENPYTQARSKSAWTQGRDTRDSNSTRQFRPSADDLLCSVW
jgi:hypothetical protein